MYVELPEEDPGKARGMCGKVLVHMYGVRPAAKGWHTEFSEFLMFDLGFERGNASQCVFVNKERGITTAVYGDDFTPVGPKVQLDWFKQALEAKYERKSLQGWAPGRATTKRRRSSTE